MVQSCLSTCLHLILLIAINFADIKAQCQSKSGTPSWRSGLEPNSFKTSPVTFSVYKTRSRKAPYKIELTTFDQHFSLTLQKSDSSIFTDGFTFQNETISNVTLKQVEKNILIDPQNMAVLRVSRAAGNYHLQGYLNGLSIVEEDCAHLALRSSEPEPIKWCGTKDKMETLDVTLNSTRETKADPINATVELSLVFDEPSGKILTSNKALGSTPIITYAAILVKSANFFYGSLTSKTEKISVQLKLLNAQILTTEQNKQIVEDSKNYMSPMLDELGNFTVNSSQKADVVTLVVQEQTYHKDSSGTSSSINGLAKITGACSSKHGVSAVRDPGGLWFGVKTVAHEVGHTLGASHDNDVPKCTSQNYLMWSLDGSGYQTVYKFSTCSQKDIYAFLRSDKAACLTNSSGGGYSPTKTLPGKVSTLSEQCAAYLQDKDLSPAPFTQNVVTDCLKFKCPIAKGGQFPLGGTQTMDRIRDGTDCTVRKQGVETKGICIKGQCTTSKAERSGHDHDEI